MSDLAERLGYRGDARVLIVTGDDLGTTHATTTGTFQALRTGLATSASLVVPAPWARLATARHRGEDVGVQLTLNAPWDLYRWGPLTNAPSLLDGDGGFPRTRVELWDHADLDEVRRECRTQIERAILWGFDVSHLSSQLDALCLRPEFFDIYLDLAVEFRLPARLPDASAERATGFPFRSLAAEAGVISPDRVLAPHDTATRASVEALLAELPTGVSELPVRAAVDTAELRAALPDWPNRVETHAWLVDSDVQALIARAGVITVGYRALRDLQRLAPAG